MNLWVWWLVFGIPLGFLLWASAFVVVCWFLYNARGKNHD